MNASQVCVLWTWWGMILKGKGAQNKVVRLVVDGEQRIVANQCTIVTLSFLVSNERLGFSHAARSRTKTIEVHTCSHEPFLQALLNTEGAENVQHFFTAAVRLAQKYCDVDLQSQVWQLHKDFGGGIEKARKEVFKNSRPCDDYAHMQRASYKVLQQYLSYPSTASAKKEKSSKKESNFDLLETVIGTSRLLPTVQLFDAVWHRAFKWLGSKSKKAVEYLQKQYFQIVTPEVLRRQYLCSTGSWDQNKLWFAGFWVGTVGTYPGSGSGSQCMESFHSSWQRKVKRDAHASPLEIFAVMQKLFREEWREQFEWGPARVHYMARQASTGVAERPNLEKHQAVPSSRLLEAPRTQNHRLAEPSVHLIANRPGRQRRPSDGDKVLGNGKFETEWSATGRDEHRSKVCKSALQSHCGGRQISRGISWLL